MPEVFFKLGPRRLSKPCSRTIGKLIVLAVVAALLYGHSSNSTSGGRDVLAAHPALLDAAFVGDRSNEQLALDTYRRYRFESGGSWIDSYTLQRNLLTVHKGPHRGSKVGSVEDLSFYDGDPRLAWTVYLDYFMRPDWLSNGEIEFSWYDWADFGDWNKLMSLESTLVNCSVLFGKRFEREFLRGAEAEAGDVLFLSERARYDDQGWYSRQKVRRNEANCPPADLSPYCEPRNRDRFQLPLEVKQLHEGVRPEVYGLQARTYLLSHVQPPLSLVVLERDSGCYRFEVRQDGRRNLVQSGLVGMYLEAHASEIDSHGDIEFDHLATYERFLNGSVAAELKVEIQGIDRSVTQQESVSLSPEDFEVDVRKIISQLRRSRAENKLSIHELRYLESLEHSIRTSPWLAGKYFTEAPRVKEFNGMGYHRDQRFFKEALIWDPEEYNARLNSLIRTWLKFTRANGLITWVAHGSAYGHLFNGQKFPWDNDHDVQMPIKHLHLLSRYFNQSLIMEDPREGNGKFLVDVGNSITVRTSGNGRNNIDARFIDIDSGLYVDITGLSVSSNPLTAKFRDLYSEKAPSVDLRNELKTFEFPELGQGLAGFDVNQLATYVASHTDQFQKQQIKEVNNGRQQEKKLQGQSNALQNGLTPEERYIMNRELHVYNCRNNHFLSLESLSPLQATLFHGAPAFLPKKNLVVLKNEYGVSSIYGFQVFEGKAFLPSLHYWFTYNVLQDFTKMNKKYPNLRAMKGTVSDVQVEDIKSVLKNMLDLNLTELFALNYLSFESIAYRVKELEIQYDATLNKDEKRQLLHILTDQIAPRIMSPAKDPTLFSYERNLWRQMMLLLGKQKSLEVQSTINQQMFEQLWLDHLQMFNRESALFQIENSSNESDQDLNKDVQPIPAANIIFQQDPDI